MTPQDQATLDNFRLVHRILTVAADVDENEFLFWRAERDGSINAYVIVNDVFAWACADLEKIAPDNIGLFEQAAKDVMAVNPPFDGEDINKRNLHVGADAGILFACRVRKMKPFKHNGGYGVHASVVPLIEAVTTEETDMDKPWKDMGYLPKGTT